jgi:uncharacterized membrane protein
MRSAGVDARSRRPEVTLLTRFTRTLRNNLFAGLLVIAPIGVTVYAFNALFESIDAILGPRLSDLLVRAFPEFVRERIPGLGIAATLLIIFVTGSLARSYVGTQLVKVWEMFIAKVPVFGTINMAAKQVMAAIAPSSGGGFRRVVLVHIDDPDSYVIGFVTGSIKTMDGEDRKNVFIPTAPNPTTGMLALMRAEQLIESDLSVEEAMRLIVSAGLVDRTGTSKAA